MRDGKRPSSVEDISQSSAPREADGARSMVPYPQPEREVVDRQVHDCGKRGNDGEPPDLTT